MNKVALMGRLVREPELRYAENDLAVCRYTLAINRRGQDEAADFITCVAFGKSAEFTSKYFTKGLRVAVIGRLQTGSYENKDGNKIYTTDVIVEEQEFADGKVSNSNTQSAEPKAATKKPSKKQASKNEDKFDDLPFADTPDDTDDDDFDVFA